MPTFAENEQSLRRLDAVNQGVKLNIVREAANVVHDKVVKTLHEANKHGLGCGCLRCRQAMQATFTWGIGMFSSEVGIGKTPDTLMPHQIDNLLPKRNSESIDKPSSFNT